ncbi:hypothetical protein N0V86_003561 [Didymella sp. IMI 355093]|nr:hypothetical protein N0V86_003561 [Didymella sp. IMI 355093]
MIILDNALKAGQSFGSAASSVWDNASPAATKGARLAKAFGNVIQERVNIATAPRNSPPAYEGASPDWAILSQFGEDIGKQVGATASEAWDALLGGYGAVSAIAQENGYKFESKEKDLEGMAQKLKRWIQEHPKEAATLLACLASALIAITLTPTMLGLIGFTPIGPAAGSIAASLQSAMGPVAAGSAFATLQSAAMGGYGAIIVDAMTATGAVTGTCSITAASFMHAMKEEGEREDSRRAA